MDFNRVFTNATPLLLQGVENTVWISLASIAIGILIGLISCLMAISRSTFLRTVSKVYVWIIRGTPMIVQAIFIFYGIPQIVQLLVARFTFTPMTAGIITLSLNAGAYLSEIFRGGIGAVNKGQMEAARSLGLSHGRAMFKIILPQAIKIALPSMVNQFIITIKDTSILSVIGLAELTNKANTFVGKTYLYFETYLFVAVFYLIVISALMVFSNHLENRISYEKHAARRKWFFGRRLDRE